MRNSSSAVRARSEVKLPFGHPIDDGAADVDFRPWLTAGVWADLLPETGCPVDSVARPLRRMVLFGHCVAKDDVAPV
jgi:hypothetical protein